jgi:hypothetical protein
MAREEVVTNERRRIELKAGINAWPSRALGRHQAIDA